MAQKNKNKKPGGGGDTGGGGGGSGGLGITKADCEKVKQTSQSRFGGLILEMIISTAGAEAKTWVAGWHCRPESFCSSGKILLVTLKIALGSFRTLWKISR